MQKENDRNGRSRDFIPWVRLRVVIVLRDALVGRGVCRKELDAVHIKGLYESDG
jgi:hypothetical protein